MSDYVKWTTSSKIPLTLKLFDPSTGLGVTGKSPEVAIRRYAKSSDGTLLDNWYWDGATFTAGPTWLTIPELDSAEYPGVYVYSFDNPGEQYIYSVYFRHSSDPIGFAIEQHLVSNECLPVSGARKIDITVKDENLSPTQGCQIDVYDAADTNVLYRVWTDANGEISIALDDGDYNLRCFATGYSFTIPEPLTVTADATLDIEGTSLISIIHPSAPDLCVVYGTVKDALGNAVSSATVEAYSITPQAVAGYQLGEKVGSTETDANGWFQLSLMRGANVRFKIEGTAFDFDRIVPNKASQDVTMWT